MPYTSITIRTDEKYIGIITLNRPEQLNTFTTTLAVELYDALITLDNSPDVRVILIRGAGKAFCAGIDVNELKGKSAMEYRTWIETMEKPLVAISRLRKPVITQVHGATVANGMGLAAAADLTIAAEGVKMGLTAINVGLNCVGPVIPVARCVGRKKALELLYYGYNSEDMEYSQQLTYMNEMFARLCTTADAREGVSAFFEKRPPVWQEK